MNQTDQRFFQKITFLHFCPFIICLSQFLVCFSPFLGQFQYSQLLWILKWTWIWAQMGWKWKPNWPNFSKKLSDSFLSIYSLYKSVSGPFWSISRSVSVFTVIVNTKTDLERGLNGLEMDQKMTKQNFQSFKISRYVLVRF